MLSNAGPGPISWTHRQSSGVGVDPAKTEAMEKWPTPINVKDVSAFVGLASYYRRYILGFSTVAAPMTNLM